MKVFTYYAPIPFIASGEQRQMLNLWSSSWSAQGWEPVVLGPEDLTWHPLSEKILRTLRALPTVNSKDYELACWARWLAMSGHGGLMTDYDVLNYGFVAADVPKNESDLVSVLCDNNPCPCVVNGLAQQYENTLKLFLDYELQPTDVERGNQPHISDQNVIQKKSDLFRPHIYDVVREYRSPGWETRALVHFCHGACHGQDRLTAMRSRR